MVRKASQLGDLVVAEQLQVELLSYARHKPSPAA